jgi:NAD(P)-dependent dehydrogenase (short-subunit alcohol dehydrogenase family)
MGRLDGRNAIIVGGHSGFGLAVAETFVAEGATVTIAGRRADVVGEVAGRLGGVGTECDITDDDQVVALVEGHVERHGGLDIGVNSAGFEQSTPFRELTAEKLRAMVEVQLVGAMFMMRHCCNAMADSGGGSFISMSSLTAHNPMGGLAAYASSKAGLEYATQIAAVEYGPDQVRVNAIGAHLIETPMTERSFRNPLLHEVMNRETPLGFPGTVDDIANATLFLCSDDARYISGQTLMVDGAASTQRLPRPQDFADLMQLRPDLAGG